MSFNFFKNFAAVKVEQVEEGMINLAASLDKEGVAEAAIKQKMEEHAERINMQQEAKAAYETEQRQYEQELALYNRYMNEAESIQRILGELEQARATIATDETNQEAAAIIAKYNEAELTADLAKILDKVEQRAPILEKEKQEAVEAEAWLREIKEVDEISTELLNLRETVNQAKRDIQQAELEKERNRKRAEQAEVVAGLRKSGSKFDVAINALKNKAQEEKAAAEVYKIKAESLTKAPEENLLGKYSTTDAPVAAESLADRLARLKSKA
jgi:chromosome segregation ATPase